MRITIDPAELQLAGFEITFSRTFERGRTVVDIQPCDALMQYFRGAGMWTDSTIKDSLLILLSGMIIKSE